MSSTIDRPQASWPRDALPQGYAINGYRIEAVLGRGGFGITYRVTDGIDQVFAIKEYFPRQFCVRQGDDVLPADDAAGEPFRDCLARFEHEARALRQLGALGDAGTGIVKVVTFFTANSTAYVVMEYLDGQRLDGLIASCPSGISPAALRLILTDLMRAIGCVHDAGLWHRDIKPANIILRADGHPVLIDFGAVRAAGTGATVTYTQIYSEGYAPIEQYAGMRQGPFSDIYSLGATAYRAIGGRGVDSFTRHQALMAGRADPLTPAQQIGAGRYDAAMLAAIDAALVVAPDQRPQSVAELAVLLDGPAGDTVRVEAAAATPPPAEAPPPAPPPPRRWRMLTVSGLAVVSAAAVIVLVSRPLPVPPVPAVREAATPPPVIQPPPPVIQSAAVPAAAGPAPADECDRLAQLPRSVMGRVPSYADGVGFETIDPQPAGAACARAMKAWPNEVRFMALAARVAARDKRYADALQLAKAAAAQGSAVALNTLANLYQDGNAGTAADDAEAMRLYRLAADQGLAVAQHNLGIKYRDGYAGLPPDEPEAVRFFRLAAAQGDIDAQRALGDMHRSQRAGLQAYDAEAARIYRLEADHGDATGAVSLGYMYEKGLGGLQKDDREAVRFYRIAADKGDASAQNNLGAMYELGRGGLNKDDREAARLYRLAADQGQPTAQSSLGNMYRDGHGGLARDDREAVRLYRLSAAAGTAVGQSNLGFMFETGRGGLAHDEREAARLYRLAAGQGEEYGQNNLARMYELGLGGLRPDKTEAIRLYRLAAAQGLATAATALKRLSP